jgi:dihydropteroate synthase
VDVPISIDTTRAEVAEAALRAGADWINDTSGLGDGGALADVVARHRCPIVLMHRFSPPRSQGEPSSRSAVMGRIVSDLERALDVARGSGIDESQILLDPGIGFGTLGADNLVIHAHIGDLAALDRPIVAGPSRKSFLGMVTGRGVDDRLAGTLASVVLLALAGVALVRVHDVAETKDALALVEAVQVAAEPRT